MKKEFGKPGFKVNVIKAFVNKTVFLKTIYRYKPEYIFNKQFEQLLMIQFLSILHSLCVIRCDTIRR